MTLGERLLDLAEEYREAKAMRADSEALGFGSEVIAREPAVIAGEYEAALRELLRD